MNTELPDILREYGAAFRGDWSPSTIDGRTVRSDMSDIATWIEQGSYPGALTARGCLGICPTGGGHWTMYCDDECEAGR